MTHTPTDLEAVLCAAYQRQAICYRQALELTVSIESCVPQGQEAGPALQAMTAMMKEISAIEAEIKEAKRLWGQPGKKPGPELEAVLKETADLIQDLLARIGEAEKHAQLQADRLAPQLDSLIRSQQMRRAYGGIMVKERGAR